jgi:hypothetical protein
LRDERKAKQEEKRLKRMLIEPMQMKRTFHWLCTKPGNRKRFYHPWANVIVIYTLPCGAKLCFLAEHPAIAHEAHTVRQFEYNAGADIDRYALCVTCEEVKIGGCPAFQKMRELVGSHMLDGREYDSLAVTIEGESNTFDGKTTIASICYGDGRCGPIAVDYRDCSENWLPALKAIAEKCDHNSYHSGDANVVVSDKAPDGTGQLSGQADVVAGIGASDGVENSHGGIIAFFRRLLGRRK